MQEFMLLLTAILLAMLFFWAGILTTLIRSIVRRKQIKFWTYLRHSAQTIALSIDLMGNVVCRDLLELTLTKNYLNYPFGNYLETISRVIGLNKYLNTLTRTGRGLAWLLNLIDPGHVERAAGLPTAPPHPRDVLIRAYLKRYWQPLAYVLTALTALQLILHAL